MNLNQFSNLEKVDWIFCSTLNELESNEGKSEEATSKTSAAKFIGPMIPSTYLDGRIKGDKGYGASLWKPLSKECIQWLDSRPQASVVYVSFGNMLALSNAQMDEIGWGLLNSGWNFLWVVKEEDGQEDRPKENIVVVRIYSLVKETVYAGVVRKPKKGRNAAISNASQK